MYKIGVQDGSKQIWHVSGAIRSRFHPLEALESNIRWVPFLFIQIEKAFTANGALSQSPKASQVDKVNIDHLRRQCALGKKE